MEKIRVGIVDNHHLFREGIQSLLEKESKFSVPLEAENGEV
jgi:DNA-binding NarL/FixJ family response regulator